MSCVVRVRAPFTSTIYIVTFSKSSFFRKMLRDLSKEVVVTCRIPQQAARRTRATRPALPACLPCTLCLTHTVATRTRAQPFDEAGLMSSHHTKRKLSSKFWPGPSPSSPGIFQHSDTRQASVRSTPYALVLYCTSFTDLGLLLEEFPICLCCLVC